MEACRQVSAASGGVAVRLPLQREQTLSWQLVESKRQWHYWQSQHKRAKQRGEQWKQRCGETEQKLAAGQQRLAQLAARVEELERETAGLKQRNRDLLQSAFGKRSKNRNSTGKGGVAAAQPARPGAAEAEPSPRSRGGQRAAVPHARAKRSGLGVWEKWLEPAADQRYCADCGKPYCRNGEEVSERIQVEVQGYVRRTRRARYRAGCGCAQRKGQPVPEVLPPLEPKRNYRLAPGHLQRAAC